MSSGRKRAAVVAALVAAVAGVLTLVPGRQQPNPPAQPTPILATPQVVQGILGETQVIVSGPVQSVAVGDQVGPLAARQPAHAFVGLVPVAGGEIRQFSVSPAQAGELVAGATVNVRVAKANFDEKDAPLQAQSVELSKLPNVLSAQGIEIAAQGGPYNYLNVTCKFPGDPEPRPTTFYKEAVQADRQGSLKWYWTQLGIDTSGAEAASSWAMMPKTKSAYVYTDNTTGYDMPRFQAVEDDCLLAALKLQPGLNPAGFKGINFIFSSAVGCCFWGGRGYALPAQLGNQNLRLNYTLSDGAYSGWVGTMGHEMGHSFPTAPNGAGLGHGADALNVLGNPLEVMSIPEYECPDKSEWGCTPQGTMGVQLLRLGVAITKLTVKPGDGVTLWDINYLYPVRNGVQLIEIPISAGHSLWIEARVGRLPTPDYKFQHIDCVAVLDTIEAGHVVPGRETVQDWILTWTGDGSDPLQDCGRVGQSITTDTGWRIQVASKLPGGFRLRIGHAGDPGWIKLYLPMALG